MVETEDIKMGCAVAPPLNHSIHKIFRMIRRINNNRNSSNILNVQRLDNVWKKLEKQNVL